MSLASTVSSVIDVPVTHSSLGGDLAGLDRRDLVLRRREDRAAGARARAPRRVDDRARDGDPDDDQRGRRRRPPRRSRAGGRGSDARRHGDAARAPCATLTSARSATAVGEPTAGMTRNGTSERADDRAERVRPRAGCRRSRRSGRGSSPSSADEAGNVKPMTNVVGRTTSSIGPRIAQALSSGAARVERAGMADDEDEADEREDRDGDLGDGDRARPAGRCAAGGRVKAARRGRSRSGTCRGSA